MRSAEGDVQTAAKAVYYSDQPEGRVVLLLSALRETPDGLEPYLDCPGPGGRLEEGETCLQALRREIREEIGVEIADDQVSAEPVATDSWPHALTGATICAEIYAVRATSLAVTLGEDKYTGYAWVAADEIAELDIRPQSKQAMLKVAGG